jgi:NAD(P)-dependent dehydrogenase (short-subunit alcohol dehydrogenase family)
MIWPQALNSCSGARVIPVVVAPASANSRAAASKDDEGAAQRVAEEVFAYGRRAILVNADVGQIDQVQAIVSTTGEGPGPIDILINNAGTALVMIAATRTVNSSPADWLDKSSCHKAN